VLDLGYPSVFCFSSLLFVIIIVPLFSALQFWQSMVSTKWSKDIEVAPVPVNRNHVKSASSSALLAFSTIEVKQLPDRNLDVGLGSCNISLYHDYTDLYSSTDIDPEWVMSEEVNRCAKKACCPWLGMDYS